jgi:hypothetical protein
MLEEMGETCADEQSIAALLTQNSMLPIGNGYRVAPQHGLVDLPTAGLIDGSQEYLDFNQPGLSSA